VVCRSRRAAFRYEMIETLECGVSLLGTEVKSLRARQASIEESHVRIEDDGLWLVGMHIAPYRDDGGQGHDPIRRRRLLARSSEIRRLSPKVAQRGLTLIPVSVQFDGRGLAKVTIALARGRNAADKRQALRARDDRRDMERGKQAGQGQAREKGRPEGGPFPSRRPPPTCPSWRWRAGP